MDRLIRGSRNSNAMACRCLPETRTPPEVYDLHERSASGKKSRNFASSPESLPRVRSKRRAARPIRTGVQTTRASSSEGRVFHSVKWPRGRSTDVENPADFSPTCSSRTPFAGLQEFHCFQLDSPMAIYLAGKEGRPRP